MPTELYSGQITGSTFPHFANNLMTQVKTMLREQHLELTTQNTAEMKMRIRYVEGRDSEGQITYQIINATNTDVPDSCVQEIEMWVKGRP